LTVDCTWNDYADWSSCSVTCGDGTRTRTRTEATSSANGGDQCTGGPTETESCNAGSCPGLILIYWDISLKSSKTENIYKLIINIQDSSLSFAMYR
jgi:hypothetical protein